MLVVLGFLEEAHDQARGNVYTPLYEVIEQTAVKSFFTLGADDRLYDKINMIPITKNSHKVTSAISWNL